MRVTILYFAGLREAVGMASEACELPDDVDTTTRLRAWLRTRGGAWEIALGAGRNVGAAVDQRMARGDATITDGAEIAFFPPVTGG
jgi:molybdopterin synthase sulfur carrier subunit